VFFGPNSKTFRGLVALVLTLASWAAPLRAQAAESPNAARAKVHYQDGVTLGRGGDWAGAVAELRTAYALAKHPRIAFELGLAYVEMADPVRATQMMKAALKDRTRLGDKALEKQARAVIAEQEPSISVVIIESPVKGARVRVNGRDVGKTPLGKPAEVRSGTVDVELTVAGRAPDHAMVEVKAGYQQSVELALEAMGAAVEVVIKADLPGAEIMVDGKRRGLTRQWRSIFVSAGEHELALRRDGYVSTPKKVKAVPGAILEVELDAKRDLGELSKSKGVLVITTDPPDARVYVDGAPAKAGEVEVVPGLHEIRVEQSLRLPITQLVEVEAGKRATVDVRLPPTAETRDEMIQEAEGQQSMVWAFGALGLGLSVGGIAVMAVGIAKLDGANNQEDDVRGSRACQFEEPSCQQGIDEAKSEQTVGLGVTLGGVGGLLLGGGSFALSVYLYLNSNDPDDIRVEVPTDLGAVTFQPDVMVTADGAYGGIRGTF
jgi:PEGA domain